MVEEQSKPECVILDGSLTTRAIDAVRARLAAALNEHAAIELDCSAAVEVDLSLIQLLIAAHRSAGEAGKRLTLTQPADGPLRAALVQGGFLPAVGPADDPEAAFWLGMAQAS